VAPGSPRASQRSASWRCSGYATTAPKLVTRAIQPILWLVIFGKTFSRIRAIPTGKRPYLDYVAPGIIAQSALFIAIFYVIQIVWERDAGVLTKLLGTPTPRVALVAGKAFAAGVRAVAQALVVVLVAALLGVAMSWNPLKLIGVVAVVVLGAAFFSCLSVTIAGIVLKRDRLMGIGQAITMPLFFASNALYPLNLMPGWLQAISKANPLSYEVSALRGLLVGTSTNLSGDDRKLFGGCRRSDGFIAWRRRRAVPVLYGRRRQRSEAPAEPDRPRMNPQDLVGELSNPGAHALLHSAALALCSVGVLST